VSATTTEARRPGVVVASAPAKVILLGEHGVNRRQPALAAAVGARARCTARIPDASEVRIVSSLAVEEGATDAVVAFSREVGRMREQDARDELRHVAEHDVLAPVRYVLGQLIERYSLGGVEVAIESEIPIGSGFGSGAAVTCALSVAVARACSAELTTRDVAALGWSGDVVAHGGVASGLDSSACALGGVVRYTLDDGPEPVPLAAPLRLVASDTGVFARTAAVNARVQAAVAADESKNRVFEQIGGLVAAAVDAVAAGELELLGHLMDDNQALLAQIGVSSPEIETLAAAARGAGALGAKLSGSGGGGIVIALCAPDTESRVADAMTAAGGRSTILTAGVAGAAVDEDHIDDELEEHVGKPR
jgi:mevalonate kinase